MVTPEESKQAENILEATQPMQHAWLLAQILDLKNDISESGKCLGYIKLENGNMAEVFLSTRAIPA